MVVRVLWIELQSRSGQIDPWVFQFLLCGHFWWHPGHRVAIWKHRIFYSAAPFTPAFYAGALRVPVIHRAGNLLVWLGQRSTSQMDLIGNLMLFMFTEKVVLKPNDVSVFTTLTINGRLFACPREQFDSLVSVNGLRRAVCAIRKPCL